MNDRRNADDADPPFGHEEKAQARLQLVPIAAGSGVLLAACGGNDESAGPERRAVAERDRRRRGQGAHASAIGRTTSTASRARPACSPPVWSTRSRCRSSSRRPASADVRFVVKPSFTWVGNATVNGSSWTTLTGTFTPPEGADPSTLQVYIGSRPALERRGAYTYLVDDLKITTGQARRARRWESCWRPTSRPGSTAGCRAATRRAIRRSRRPAPRRTAARGRRWSPVAPHRATASGATSPRSWFPASPTQITAWVKFAAGQGNGAIWLEHAARQRRRHRPSTRSRRSRRHRRRVEPR